MDLPRKTSRGRKKMPFADLDQINIKEKNPPVDYTIVKPLSQMRAYAGETEKYELREIVYFKQTGEFPQSIYDSNVKPSKRKSNFLSKAENYQLLDEEISVLSRSKLCHFIAITSEKKVIPFQDEMEDIMKVLHIEDGKHITVTRSRKRAFALKVIWRNYWDEIDIYASQCICYGLVGKKMKAKKD